MNKNYYELKIKPSVYYELFLDLINSLTTNAIEELNGTIIVRSEDNLEDIKNGIKSFQHELEIAFNTTIKCDISLETKENINWIEAYQNSVKPIEAGDFYIHPSWEQPLQNKQNILIDPALTFGSGHHETTNSCLILISKYITTGQNVADIGCGSGILGIASAKLGANIDICDTDKLAVEDAKKNFKSNCVTFNNSWVGSASNSTITYDVIIANIVADVLIMIHKDLKKIIKDNGIIILSGIMDIYQNKVLNKFKDLEVLETIKQNEWVTLVLKKVKIDEQ